MTGISNGDSHIPAVSVVIPSYNRMRSLPAALESVLRQTFDDIEVIVVDDCSSDGTLEYLRNITDTRLRVIRHDKNKGGGAARNTGINAARAQLVAFQDSDDQWLVNKLAVQMEAYSKLDQAEYGAIYCAKVVVGRNQSGICGPREISHMPRPNYDITSGDLYRELLLRAMVGPPTLVVQTGLLREVGGFDESLKLGQDWDLTIRLAQRTKFAFVDRALVMCFTSPDSISEVRTNQAASRYSTLRKNISTIQQDKKLHAFYLFQIARVHQRAGCWRQSVPWAAKMIKVRPADHRGWLALGMGLLRSITSAKRLDLI